VKKNNKVAFSRAIDALEKVLKLVEASGEKAKTEEDWEDDIVELNATIQFLLSMEKTYLSE